MNYHTPREKCSVKYKDLDHAVRVYLLLCDEVVNTQWCHAQETDETATVAKEGWKPWSWKENFLPNHKRKPSIFARKSDIKSAFRILGLAKRCWKWLVMKAQDPVSGVWFYFVDKCLPFGASISCALFQEFSDALCYLVEVRTKVRPTQLQIIWMIFYFLQEPSSNVTT